MDNCQTPKRIHFSKAVSTFINYILPDLISSIRLIMYNMYYELGSCQDEDCQEGCQSHHREVLHSINIRLPHQQKDM